MASLDDFLGADPSAQPSGGGAASAGMLGGVPLDVYRVMLQEDPAHPQQIASEIYNRAAQGNQSLYDVVHGRNQYGPGSPTSSPEYKQWLPLSNLGADDPRIQKLAAATGDILTGKTPAPYAYTFHYSPVAQAKWGRQPPSFENGQGVDVGTNRYFAQPYTAAGGIKGVGLDDFLGSEDGSVPPPAGPDAKPGAAPTAPAAASPQGFALTRGAQTVGYTTPQQTAAIQADKGRIQGAGAGTRGNPYGYGPTQGVLRGGDWYYDEKTGQPTQYQDPDTLLNTAESVGKLAGNPLFYGAQGLGEGQLDPRTQAAVEGFKNNVFFGGASKLEGGAMALAGGDYNKTVAAQDAYRNALRERFPGVYDTSAVAGAVAPMFVGGEGVEAAARGAAEVAPNAARALRFATGTAPAENAFARLAVNAPGAAATAGLQGFASGLGGSRASSLQGQVGDATEQALGAGGLGLLSHGVFGGTRALASLGEPFLAPWTAGGRAGLVGNKLNAFMGNPAGTPATDFTEYVPGSHPTLPQALVGEERIPAAAAERTLRSGVTDSSMQAARESNAALVDQDKARHDYVDPVIGTPADTRAARVQVRESLEPERQAAFANKQPVDPQPVLDTIDSILASPDGKISAVRNSMQAIRKNIVNKEGAPAEYDNRTLPPTQTRAATPQELETDPEQLWGVRMDMDAKSNRLSPEYGDTQLAGKQIQKVRDVLDGVVAQGAPDFAAYNAKYRAAMKPLNAQEYLQDHNWTNNPNVNSPSGEFSLAKVNNGIKKIEADRALPGWNAAKDISDEDLGKLYNLRADLTRADLTSAYRASARGPQITGNIEKPAPIRNALLSPTMLGAESLAAGAGLPGAVAIATGKQLLDERNKLVNQQTIRSIYRPDPNMPFGAATNAAKAPGRFNRMLRAGAASVPRVMSSPAPKRPTVAIP